MKSSKTKLNVLMLAPFVGLMFFAPANIQGQLLQGFEVPTKRGTVAPFGATLKNQGNKQPEAQPRIQGGSLLFTDLTTPAIDLDRQEIPARSSNSTVLTLSAKERGIARAAWSYVENNMDPETGLVRAIEQSNVVTMWDLGNAIAAVESARTLNLISKADYDQKIRLIIRSLAAVETYAGIPNHLIDIRTGRHPKPAKFDEDSEATQFAQMRPKGFQSKDLAYLLVWLEAAKRNTPYLANPIDSLVAKWNFCGLRQPNGDFANQFSLNGKPVRQPVQGLGYDAFTRKAFSLWGFQTHQSTPKEIRNHQVFGIDFPLPVNKDQIEAGSLFGETFWLDGLLFGWDQPQDLVSELLEFTDGWRAEMAHRMYQLQYERYQQTGILTARASHFDQVQPSMSTLGMSNLGGKENNISYIQQPLIDRGIGFKTIDSNHIPLPKLAGVSTKAAISIWALWDTAYSRLLLEAVADTFDRTRGFPEGLFENYAGQIDVYSLDTNAAVLMALAFKHGSVLVPKQNSQGPSLWDKLRQNANLQSSLCLPKRNFENGTSITTNISYDPYAAADLVQPATNSPTSMMALSYQHCDVKQDSPTVGSKTVGNCRFFGN